MEWLFNFAILSLVVFLFIYSKILPYEAQLFTKFKKPFDKISKKSNSYIENSFEIALKLLKTKKFSGLINGPVSKKVFLGEKHLGITEYLANKTNKKDKVTMMIYNKNLSVSPITTHICPLVFRIQAQLVLTRHLYWTLY